MTARPLMMLAWALGMILVGSGVHYYLWARLVRAPALPAPWRHVATALIVVLGISIPATVFTARLWGRELVAPFIWLVFVWMGLILFLVVLVGVGDLVRLGTYVTKKLRASPVDPERRLLVARIVAGGAVGGAALLGGMGVREGLRIPRRRDVRVELERLPRELSGTRIVQITDLHVGQPVGRRYVEEVVHRVNAMQPDIIAITGDLVDGRVRELRSQVAPLGELVARHGVYFVTGNHEYYSGVEPWLSELERLHMHVLRNERVSIGKGKQSFDLAGVDDFRSKGFTPGHGPDLKKAVAGRDPSRELVLLAHQPREIYSAAEHGVGLMISGHTHGGQLWPFTHLVGLTQPYMADLHRHNERTQIYVSRGTGYWGPPMRVGAPSEITHIELASGVGAERDDLDAARHDPRSAAG